MNASKGNNSAVALVAFSLSRWSWSHLWRCKNCCGFNWVAKEILENNVPKCQSVKIFHDLTGGGICSWVLSSTCGYACSWAMVKNGCRWRKGRVRPSVRPSVHFSESAFTIQRDDFSNSFQIPLRIARPFHSRFPRTSRLRRYPSFFRIWILFNFSGKGKIIEISPNKSIIKINT